MPKIPFFQHRNLWLELHNALSTMRTIGHPAQQHYNGPGSYERFQATCKEWDEAVKIVNTIMAGLDPWRMGERGWFSLWKCPICHHEIWPWQRKLHLRINRSKVQAWHEECFKRGW